MAPYRRLPAAHRLVLAAFLAGLPAVPALGQERDDRVEIERSVYGSVTWEC